MAHADTLPAATVEWPAGGLTRVPYAIYADPAIYQREQATIFRGRAWHFLCLESEVEKSGDWRTGRIGDAPVVVTRAPDGSLNAFENRCAHRGALICLKPCGNNTRLTCVYHSWSYDLKGNLAGVAFRNGVDGKGGMAKEFDAKQHGLKRIHVGTFRGLVFGSYADGMPSVEDWLGPRIAAHIARVLHKPIKTLGRFTQVLPNNWKLYAENLRDSYHASLLHVFFTTFKLNRLSQPGGIIVDDSGGHHISYSRLSTRNSAEYDEQGIRSSKSDFRLNDPSMLISRDEIGDGIGTQVLAVYPTFGLQQHLNSLAFRHFQPNGIGETELHWTYFGYADDDEETTLLRLKQGNLTGPGGYVSMEDGCIGSFVERGIAGSHDDAGVVMMGGHTAESQSTRATETGVRGFWQAYRQQMAL